MGDPLKVINIVLWDKDILGEPIIFLVLINTRAVLISEPICETKNQAEQ